MAGTRTPFATSSQALESGNHVRLTPLTLAYDVLATGGPAVPACGWAAKTCS